MDPLRSRLCKRDYSPPFLAEDVSAYAFILRGDADSIRRSVVRPTLGQDFDLIPWADDLFVLAWVEYGSLTSLTPPDNTRGAFAYKESATYSLVESRLNGWTDDPLCLFISSLYVDKAAPIITGIETYGFPKCWGDIAIRPQGGNHFMTFANEIHKYGFPPEQPRHSLVYEAEQVSNSGNSHARRVTNDGMDDPESFVDSALLTLRDDIEKIVGDVEGGMEPLEHDLVDAVMRIVRHFSTWEPPLVFLKQFPSSQRVGEMCYGSYVRAEFTPQHVRELTLLHGYKVRIYDFDSAPIASSYGVKPGADLQPLLGFSVKCDFRLGDGDERLIISPAPLGPTLTAAPVPAVPAATDDGRLGKLTHAVLGLSKDLAGNYVRFLGEVAEHAASVSSSVMPKPFGSVVGGLARSFKRASDRLGDGLRRRP